MFYYKQILVCIFNIPCSCFGAACGFSNSKFMKLFACFHVCRWCCPYFDMAICKCCAVAFWIDNTFLYSAQRVYTTCLFWYQFLTICLIAYYHILTFWYLNCRIQMWLLQILFRAFSFTNLHFHNSMTIIHSLQFVFYVPNCMWFMQMLCGLLQEIISVTGKGSWYSGQGFYVPCKIYV